MFSSRCLSKYNKRCTIIGKIVQTHPNVTLQYKSREVSIRATFPSAFSKGETIRAFGVLKKDTFFMDAYVALASGDLVFIDAFKREISAFVVHELFLNK
ncbi:hypothetical protein NEDG_01009 [Nematocida displodere]|uniref:Uncharacterized protein n=1 Tax=Nematocida displodere TaxID=1805483 RepID=A0A177EBV6_9MICR|nr:hypothetical protein NEDG_01009 [Nematocida displodere]